MKKYNAIICAAMLCAAMCACGSKHQYTISGTVGAPEMEGQTVYLVDMDKAYAANDATAGLVDSAVVTGGKFSFKGTVDEPWMALLSSIESPYSVTLVVEPGDIVVNADSIGGTALNDSFRAYTQSLDLNDIEMQMQEYLPLYYGAASAAERAAAERVLDSLDALGNARVLDATWNLYHANGDNLLGVMAMETIAQVGEFTYSELDSIVRAASPRVAASQQVQERLAQLRAIEQTSVGKHYTDIQGVDGKLSDLIDGKLALIDFYASWCGPCRNEIRDNLVPLWKKYQQKGLVIVGLNVWERGDREAREAAHQKVMTDLGITYPQLVDSTRTATDTYGVNGIPQIMLIGPDGTILARDLRGAAIEEAIVNALGN